MNYINSPVCHRCISRPQAAAACFHVKLVSAASPQESKSPAACSSLVSLISREESILKGDWGTRMHEADVDADQCRRH